MFQITVATTTKGRLTTEDRHTSNKIIIRLGSTTIITIIIMVVIRAIIVIKEEEMTGISNKVDLLDLTKIDTKRVIDIQEDRLQMNNILRLSSKMYII